MADVVDHFAALGIDRSASIDEALVRERFHELSRELHPDAGGGDQAAFALINEAQRVLRSPGGRLRHLLELEFGERPASGGNLSPQMMALFAQVGDALSRADEVIAKLRAATSSVGKALLAGDNLEAGRGLMAASGLLMGRRREIEAQLPALGLREKEALIAAWHELSFLDKWQKQLQERVGALL